MSDPSSNREEASEFAQRLGTRVTGLEAHVTGLEEKVGAIHEGQKSLFAKFDALATQIASLAAGSGRVSTGMVMTLVGTITPIVIAAAALGHVFVKSEDARRDDRIAAVGVQVENVNSRLSDQIGANAATSDRLMEMVENMAKQNAEFIDRLNQTRFTASDHREFLSREFEPLQAHERDNALAVARLEERLDAVVEQLDDHRHEANHPFGVLVEIERLRAEMTERLKLEGGAHPSTP